MAPVLQRLVDVMQYGWQIIITRAAMVTAVSRSNCNPNFQSVVLTRYRTNKLESPAITPLCDHLHQLQFHDFEHAWLLSLL